MLYVTVWKAQAAAHRLQSAYQLVEDLVCEGSVRASQVLPLPIHFQVLLRQLHSSDSLPLISLVGLT